MKDKIEIKQLKDADGFLVYEGETIYDKPYGFGKTFFKNGNIYQEGVFGIKGLLKGKEYYPSSYLRFEGIFQICSGYGPNYPIEGKCYDDNGNIYFIGEITTTASGVGYRTVRKPPNYGPIVQQDIPSISYFMWEDEKRLKGK